MQTIENIQIGTYTSEAGGFYDWHVDQSLLFRADNQDQPRQRVLSASVQLTSSKDYAGGDLHVGTSVAAKELGDAIFFPSFEVIH